jgi:hypothetical protein
MFTSILNQQRLISELEHTQNPQQRTAHWWFSRRITDITSEKRGIQFPDFWGLMPFEVAFPNIQTQIIEES